MTKLDILDSFDEIKIGITYKLNGKTLDSMPGECIKPFPFLIEFFFFFFAAEQSELEKVEVEYITMPGWKTSIAHLKSMSELPPNAIAYIKKLEELVGVRSKSF